MIKRLATEFTRKRSRELRREAPPSEVALWRLLRRKQIAGVGFRRRATILGRMPDFYCPAARLVIEIDAGVSQWKRNRDTVRDRLFAAEGIKTLHVEASRIFNDKTALIEEIAAVVKERARRG